MQNPPLKNLCVSAFKFLSSFGCAGRGKGFTLGKRLVSHQRFTFDNEHFYVDLVFYNRLLQCYVLIDLKRDKLTHKDLGQM